MCSDGSSWDDPISPPFPISIHRWMNENKRKSYYFVAPEKCYIFIWKRALQFTHCHKQLWGALVSRVIAHCPPEIYSSLLATSLQTKMSADHIIRLRFRDMTQLTNTASRSGIASYEFSSFRRCFSTSICTRCSPFGRSVCKAE